MTEAEAAKEEDGGKEENGGAAQSTPVQLPSVSSSEDTDAKSSKSSTWTTMVPTVWLCITLAVAFIWSLAALVTGGTDEYQTKVNGAGGVATAAYFCKETYELLKVVFEQ